MLAVRGSSTQRTTLPQAARIAPTGPRANVRAALATSGSTALANANNPTTRRVRAAREPPLQCPLHGSIASDRRKACLCGRSPRARRPRHGIAVPLRRTEMPVVQAILRAAGGQCRGDPVGRPAGPWRAGSRDDAVPSCTIAPGRRTASPLHAPQDRPSPGAARRPLPARERRLFVASLGTDGSFLSTHSTDLHPTAGQCRGDPVGRPFGAARALGPRWLVRSRRAQRCQGDAPRRGRTGCGGCPGTALTTCPLHGSIASDRRKACLCGRSSRATRLRHGTAVPLHHAETRVVHTILRPAGRCRGDRTTPASSAGTLRESAEEAQPQYWSSAVGAVLVAGH